MRRNKKKKNAFYIRKGQTQQEKDYENNAISINHQRLMRDKNSRRK